MGCNGWHPQDFLIDYPAGWDCYILLMVKSKAFFRFGGASMPQTQVEPDTLVLLPKGTPLFYGARAEPYINDWILFDAEKKLMDEWGLSFCSPVPLNSRYRIAPLFDQLSDAFFSEGPYSDRICSHLLSAILDMMAALSTNQSVETHYRELLALRKEVYHQPGRSWTIEEASGTMGLSRAYFQALYRKVFGTTFNADVISSRLGLACEMLENGNLSVKEIGFACGYHSQVHFCRQFREIKGLSPQEYRQKSRLRL